MSSDAPDYELDDTRLITTANELKSAFHPFRGVLLDLLLERAASVRELAEAVGRPPSTVAYHVDALVEAGLVDVVRTRRVRAVEERLYGRTARIFVVGRIQPEQVGSITNLLVEAAAESVRAHEADELRAIVRHARIAQDRLPDFWARVTALASEFSSRAPSGDATYTFVAGLFPNDRPSLGPPSDRDSADAAEPSRPPADRS
jgi:DNA-binding transcriptional ArsR family regulator